MKGRREQGAGALQRLSPKWASRAQDTEVNSHYNTTGLVRWTGRDGMTLMPWNSELETGIAIVDTQHQWLVDAINALHDEVSKAEPDRQVVEEVLVGLVDYTYNHFIMEESLFQEHAYPEEAAHREEHNRFTARAAGLLEAHDNGELPGDEAMQFLKDWLTHHIMKVDMAYVPFLKGRGVT